MFGILAAACSGLFAGAALYINVAEHPARMMSGVEAALRQWAPSYKRAAVMQASLAVLGSAAALVEWMRGGSQAFLAGALLLFAVVPITLIVIRPTNDRLLRLHDQLRGGAVPLAMEEAKRLLRRWNALHAIRSILGLASFVVMLAALSGR